MPRTPRHFTTEPLDLPSSHPHKVQTNRSLPCNFAHDFPVLGFRQLSHALAAAVYSRQYKASNHHHSPAKNRSAALRHNNRRTAAPLARGSLPQQQLHVPRVHERPRRFHTTDTLGHDTTDQHAPSPTDRTQPAPAAVPLTTPSACQSGIRLAITMRILTFRRLLRQTTSRSSTASWL